MPKVYGELPLAGTIVIEVPRKVLKFTKKGEVKIVNTLTKSGGIGKLGGLPNVKLVPVNGTEARVVSQGKTQAASKAAREGMRDYDEEVRKYERRGQEVLARKRPSVVRKKMKEYNMRNPRYEFKNPQQSLIEFGHADPNMHSMMSQYHPLVDAAFDETNVADILSQAQPARRRGRPAGLSKEERDARSAEIEALKHARKLERSNAIKAGQQKRKAQIKIASVFRGHLGRLHAKKLF